MRASLFFSAVLALLATLGLTAPVRAQQLNNDGFQRRNGQMHIVRNGQRRPMTRDARLPTGTVVTKDGFVVGPGGTRTELREGQGCDLRGNVVSVVEHGGALALGAPAGPRRAPHPAEQVRAVLTDLLGGRYEPRDYYEDEEHGRKAEERAREQRKKEEEWRRESAKKYEEFQRERGKKGKEKWKKHKGWDD
jgi:hypothetical protein